MQGCNTWCNINNRQPTVQLQARDEYDSGLASEIESIYNTERERDVERCGRTRDESIRTETADTGSPRLAALLLGRAHDMHDAPRRMWHGLCNFHWSDCGVGDLWVNKALGGRPSLGTSPVPACSRGCAAAVSFLFGRPRLRLSRASPPIPRWCPVRDCSSPFYLAYMSVVTLT